MASNRGRYSLTPPSRSYSSPSSSIAISPPTSKTSSPSTAISPPMSKTSSQQQQQQQRQQKRPSRRDPINITKGAGTSSISSSVSTANSSSSSSSSSASPSSYSSSPLSQQQCHNEVPSAFRRSMSPIGGAAFAMRNFLRRKRGSTFDGNNNQIAIGGDMEAINPHDHAPQSQHQQHRGQHQQQRPSLMMQSFVLVGGVDTSTTTTPITIYDIDAGSFSDPESVPVSRCQSPVSGHLLSSIATNLSSSPSTTTSTFSQAMKSRFGRDRTPTSPGTPAPGTLTGTPTALSPSSSFRRSRSRNPSAPATETLTHGTATGTGTACVTGGGALLASMRKKLNRRSLSADSVPVSSSSSPPTPSSLPRPYKAIVQSQVQAQKLVLANAQGGAGSVGGRGAGRGDISIGMSMHFSGSNVGGSELPSPKNSSSSKDKDKNSGGGGATGGEAVAFQDARNEVSGGGALVMSRQQGACSGKNNTETSGGHNSKINNDIDDDDFNALDMTLRSSDLSSCSLDPADVSTTAADNLDDDGENQQKRNRLLLQQNSIAFLSVERARTRPRDGVPPILSKKTLRRQSDSTLFSSIAANGSRVMLDTSLALEDLEKEIRDLKAKEALLHSISATKDHHKTESSTCDLPRKGRLAAPPRREAKILLVSSSALPTQFYDSSKTRNVLRTYLTNSGLEFDEMIEYGFPSEAFMNDDDLDDNNDDDLGPENSHQQQKASMAELAPSCRFLTLRITLTPWHARADESTLYGPRATMGRQLQFKAMVNRFFSRSGNTTTTDVIAAPLSSLSPSSAPVGEPASPEMNPQRSVDTLPTSVSLSALDAAGGDSVTPISSSRPPSRAATGGLRTPSGSRANSRASSPRRDRSSPSSHRASPAATEHCGSNVITPLLPSHILSPNYVSSRATPTTSTTTTTGGEHSSARIGRRLFSPTPSSSSSYSMIPLPIGTGSSSQPPRKGSLSALSLPLGSQQPQTPTSASSSLATHAPIVPPRRKGSTPALFFTPPPPPSPSNHGLRSANSTGGREVYPSPSSRAAAQTHGASPPPRRPSDQSDTISASLAFARSVNTSGTGGQYSRYLDSTLDGRPLRKKVDTELRAHSKRQHFPRNPHSIHAKQQQKTTSSSPPSPSPSPCPPSSSSSGRRGRQGSHSRLPTLDHLNQIQQQQSISLPFSEQGSEEQIYECYHVAGLDNIYRNNNTTSRQPAPLVSATVEKSIHPFQTVPHQLPIRQGTKLFHFSNRRDGSGKGGCQESRIGVLASSAVGSSGLLAAAEQTPQSAAPPRIQAKNQRRPGGGCASTTASRSRPAGSTDRAHRRHNYINIKRREEDEMDEYVVHVGDISFVDGLEDLEDDEEQKRREREEVAAVGIEGCWRPIACHQTSTMKTFAFP